MNEALSSILCGEKDWFYHFQQFIIFKADGTGELYCGAEANWFIALAFSWRILSTPPPAAPVAVKASSRSPQLLGQLNVEITLGRKLASNVPEWIRKCSKQLIEERFCDDAFCPKPFTIRIEKGNFLEPSEVGRKGWQGWRYSMRLLFDKSPCPPRNEWMKPEGGPDACRFWELAEFVARRDEGLDGKGRAMNDASTGCVVC